MQTLVKAGTIVTVDPQRTILRDGGILISDDRIEQVLRADELSALGDFQGEIRDATSLIAIPGFIQTHIHLCQTLFRGLADDLELLDWLRLRIFPLEAAHNARSIRASAMLGIAELIRCGTTTIMDMGTVNHEEEIVEAIEESGLRALVGKAMMDVNERYGKLKESTKESLQSSLKLAESVLRDSDKRIRYAFAPRFVLSCSEELLRETSDMAASLGALVHTHAAENKSEIDAVRNRCAMDNIEYFHQIGMLGDRTCLAHCIWLSPKEVDLMSERRAKVLHCPSSNLKLGSGIANIPEYLSKGITVSLGADGAACNNTLDIFSEMRIAALIQKPLHGPKAMPARTVFEAATIGGARTLGLEREIGSIERGKKADVVLLDVEHVWNPATEDDGGLYSTLVYACDPRNVHSVMVDGQWLLRNGKPTRIDEPALVASARSELRKVLKRTEL